MSLSITRLIASVLFPFYTLSYSVTLASCSIVDVRISAESAFHRTVWFVCGGCGIVPNCLIVPLGESLQNVLGS